MAFSYAVLPEYSTALAQFQVGRLGTYEVLPQDILPTKQVHPEMTAPCRRGIPNIEQLD